MFVIIQSLFLGHPGTYDILGINVTFKNTKAASISFSDNLIGNLGENILKSRAFHILTFGYLHTFVHEMGHALAHKVFGGSSKIEISVSYLSGSTSNISGKQLSRVQSSVCSLCGPLADVIFSVSLIFAAFALSTYITLPVASMIAIGASIWIFGEAFYAVDSLLQNNHGDFGMIARNGLDHLMSATAVMVGVIVLGIFATIRVM